MRLRLGSILAVILGLSSSLFAQQQGSWSNLNSLKAGQHIQVVETNLKRHDGKFIAATDDLLSLHEDAADISIKRDAVARVSTSSGAKRGQHVLIGLVTGAAAGAAIGALSGSSHGFLGGSSRGLTALAGIVIGAPSGAIVGAAVPAHKTVYRSAANERSFTGPEKN